MSLLQLLFGFNGRIRRSQWWLVSTGAFFGAIAIAMALVFATMAAFGPSADQPEIVKTIGGSILLGLYVALIWIQLALSVKRYHDRDHTGFWLLLLLIPLGQFWVFIELGFLDGTQGPNRFGSSPKGIGGADLARVFS